MSAPHSPADVVSPMAELITLPDAAELLGVPITTVHQLIKDGKLVVVPGTSRAGGRCRGSFVAAGAWC